MVRTLQLLIMRVDPCRALVCFERQVVAQCRAVAPRPCAVYVASDSGAASGPLPPPPGALTLTLHLLLSWTPMHARNMKFRIMHFFGNVRSPRHTDCGWVILLVRASGPPHSGGDAVGQG